MNSSLEKTSGHSENMVRATTTGRLFCICVVVLCIVLIALFFLYVLPILRISMIQTPPAHAVLIIKATLVIFTAIGIVFGGLAIQQGVRILRLGQYPLPNAWVWRDTTIIRGPRSNGIGWFSIILGIMTCIVSIGLTGLILYSFSNLTMDTPEYKLRKDIKILQEKKYTANATNIRT